MAAIGALGVERHRSRRSCGVTDPARSGNWTVRPIDAVCSGTVAVNSCQACSTSARNGSCAAHGRCHGVGPVEDGRSSGPDNHVPDAAATPPHQR
jgi:hypothetical protein